ncbi:MAG: hypothetical protein LBQ66_03085 [Planctomycetaceae bacterium]|jgi:Ca2+-binding EF-hand superfamily protein|nr:hypothetical protein [Planctomycetaceae bacterium]
MRLITTLIFLCLLFFGQRVFVDLLQGQEPPRREFPRGGEFGRREGGGEFGRREGGGARREGGGETRREGGARRESGNNNEAEQRQRTANRNERDIQRLREFDTNKNGILEQNEMSDPSRKEAVNGIVTRLGGTAGQPTVNIAELAKKAAANQNQAAQSGNPNLPSDPLVPYFGETEETMPAVLTFGTRENTPTNTVAQNNSTTKNNPNSEKLNSARTTMTKFDTNHNGTLDKDKNEWNGLPFDASGADKNKDGRISMDELVVALGGTANAAVPALVKVKPSIPYEHLPAGVPDWFFKRDTDQDAQLTMLEYAKGDDDYVKNGELNDRIATEFMFLDRNNDGVATVAEIFQTLKKVDDEKQKQADLERREKELKLGNANNKVLSSRIASSTSPNTTVTTTTLNYQPPQPQPMPTWGAGGTPPPPPPNWGAGGTPPPPPNWGAGGTPPPPPNWGEGGIPSRPPQDGENKPVSVFPNPQPPVPVPAEEPAAKEGGWKPGSPTTAPTTTPTTAPYANGTNNENRNNSRNWGRSRSKR